MDRTDIEQAAQRHGFTIAEWRDTDDGDTAVMEGRFVVVIEDESEGLFEGEEGELTACIVGAAEYGNERVCWSFGQPGVMDAMEVRSLSSVEPAGE